MTPDQARVVLGVSDTADAQEILVAYRSLARMMHPDRFAGRPESEVRLATIAYQRLDEAFRVLRNGSPSSNEGTEQNPPRNSSPPRNGDDFRTSRALPPEVFRDGGTIAVETPMGRRILRIRPATKPGTVLRVRGAGFPGTAGASAGSMFVRISLIVETNDLPAKTALTVSSSPSRSFAKPLWIAAAVIVAAVIFAATTAQRWTETLVPAQAATYRTENYQTGAFIVTDDGINPCWVDQEWSDCINLLVNEYNGACAGVTLTATSSAYCDSYAAMIEHMKQEDEAGYYVCTLGSYGHLQRTSELAERRVSNEDERPAVTREAVCYLGFLGNCP